MAVGVRRESGYRSRMRLREIQHALQTALSALAEVRFEQGSNPSGAAMVTLYARGKLRDAAREVQSISALQDDAAAVLAKSELDSGDTVGMSAQHGGELGALTSQLRSKSTMLLSVLDATLPVEDPSAISIRLPDTEDPIDLAAVITDVATALDGPTRRLFHRGLRVHGFDVGSKWLELAVQAGDASSVTIILAFIAALLEYVHRYRKESIRIEMMREHSRVMASNARIIEKADKTAAALVENLAIVATHHLDEIAVASASELVDKHAPKTLDDAGKNEARNAIVHSIKVLDGLHKRRMQVHFSLLADKSVIKNAPSPKEQERLGGRIDDPSALLTEGDSST